MDHCTARMELVSNVLKEPHGKVAPNTMRFFDDGTVRQLLRDFHDAIKYGSEQYFLGVIALEQRAKGTLILVDGRKRLTTIAILLDCIRHRLTGSKREHGQRYSREMMRCIDEFLDDLVKPMQEAARVKALHRWLEFIERRVCIATVTAPSRGFMKVTRHVHQESARR